MSLFKKKTLIKRIICPLVIAATVISLPVSDGFEYSTSKWGSETVHAESAKKKKKKAEEDLRKKNAEINELNKKKKTLETDLATAAANLKKVIAAQKELENNIEKKQDEIDKCTEDLAKAKEDEKNEYEAMKKRIQFMYENSSNDSIWTAILEADGIADMLNRIEYVSDVYKSDRDLMDNYQAIVTQVEELSEQLASDMEDMVALQDKYETRQTEIEATVLALEKEKDKYADQISDARAAADAYKKKIDKYAKIIQQQEAAAAGQGDGYGGGGSGNGGLDSSVKYLTDPSYDPTPRTSVKGTAVVAYALKFVGNPYVWGGNSLTKGCDCSGFVHLIYKHFGISTPRYSQAFKNQGQPVAFCNIKAGDVVVYPGHVAIYIGNGCIVEAQSTRAGITKYRSVKCHTITGLRRYV